MSLRHWALKPSEVKSLSREALLFLAGRCVLRVAPWCPLEASTRFTEGLSLVESAARGVPIDRDAVLSLSRWIRDAGARACNALDATDELTGRCMNYATFSLWLSLEAATLPERKPVERLVLDVAKQSTAFAALHAHAGLVRAPAGRDAVEYACVKVWDEVRLDVAKLAVGPVTSSLAELRALWTSRAPGWSQPLSAAQS